MIDELPKRKEIRLKGYDYSQSGAYFITICAKNREEIFGDIAVGAVVNRPIANRPVYTELSYIGKIIDKEIRIMQEIRKNVSIDKYVIMPNHIHMIMVITEENRRSTTKNGRLTTAPTMGTTVSEIIRLWKRAISKQVGFSLWQLSFHDHIIRNENDYITIAEYIENNPSSWENDRFNPKNK